MPGVKTSAGTLFSVAVAAPATFDGAGYAALTWIAVGEIVDLGEFGRKYNLVTHNPLKTRATQKFKGSFNEGQLSVKLGLDTDDVGQIAMKANTTSDSPISVKVQTQNGDVYYFQAQIMSWVVGIGSVDTITSASADLELTSSASGVGIVEVLAA